MAGRPDRLFESIGAEEKRMVATLSAMVGIRSISPTSGGTGEAKRTDYLEKILRGWGFAPKRYDYRDGTGTVRSNLVTVYGRAERTLWIVAHIDTVAEGDLSFWKTDPFKAVVKGGRIYGRGTNDDGQAVIAGMYALKVLKETKAKLKYNFGLVLVADEEVGSTWGIQKLIKEGIFDRRDLFLVPDWGTPRGDAIEIAEKGEIWLKLTFIGKQVHASTPQNGNNAYRHAIRFLNDVDVFLHKKYNKRDRMFSPDVSTFEMTKHEKNVDSINIVPGSEVSYIDCRVLPTYRLDDVLGDVKAMAKAYKGAKIHVEEFSREESPVTRSNSEIVRLLSKAIEQQRGKRPKMIGIGGGTCAAFFRNKGYDVAVWSTMPDIAHQPNEYTVIRYIIDDAKVMASLFV